MNVLETIESEKLIEWVKNAEVDLSDPNWGDPRSHYGRGFRQLQLTAWQEELQRRGIRSREELLAIDDSALRFKP